MPDSNTSPQGRTYIAPLLRIDGEGVQLAKLSHHHLAIMDFMLANPRVPMWAVANEFNRTQAWLSTVVHSDLFQAHMQERRRLIEDDQRQSINHRLFVAAEKGLDSMINALDDDEVSVAEKRAISELALKAQGYFDSGKSGTTIQVNTQVNNDAAVKTSAVQQARERILSRTSEAKAESLGIKRPALVICDDKTSGG